MSNLPKYAVDRHVCRSGAMKYENPRPTLIHQRFGNEIITHCDPMSAKNKRRWYQRPWIVVSLATTALLVALIVSVIVSTVIESNRPTFYEKGSDFRLDKLPPSAHDVRFAPVSPFSSLGLTYEFRCTEADYRDWVARIRQKNPDLGEIHIQDFGQQPTIDKSGVIELVPLRDYLISEWRFEDRGIHLVYDPATGRAIRWSHSR